jgi:hypothetical protein
MLIFPLLYACSFFYAVNSIVKRHYGDLLIFLIFGLPFYITSLTVLHQAGMDWLLPFFQYSKEAIILLLFSMLLLRMDQWPQLNRLDRLILIFFVWNVLYVFLPLGSYTFYEKVIAFKNMAFFPLVYFIGRWLDLRQFWLSKLQGMIMLLAILSALVLLIEIFMGTHLQAFTGYAAYYRNFFNVEPAGNYGLSWSFEIEGGVKRFASFFANPLEHAASSVLTAGVLVSYAAQQTIPEKKFFGLALFCSILTVVFALSRASMAGYLLASYLFFLINGNKKILWVYHGVFLLSVLTLVYLFSNDIITDFFLNTISFTNSSSLSHLLEWIDGIEAISQHPLGLGLGESGRVAGEFGLNIGGENQLIIIGVQSGLIALVLYVWIYALIIQWSARLFLYSDGVNRQLGILLFVFKTGLIVAVLTAAVESYLYVSYTGWFLTGIMSAVYDASFLQKPGD